MDGLVLVDKAQGWTSHDVVARCRRIFGQRRVGHGGTLDPPATGLLLVGLGRVTRLLGYLAAAPKCYEAEVVLGVSTSTGDATGEILATWDMAEVPLAQVRKAAEALTGEILQVPPMVSAVKVGGRRLYELARTGVEVERAARSVTVYRLDLHCTPEPGVFRMEVECSSGTYVRTLATDLGQALRGGAHLRKLRRTRIGSFGVDQACVVEELSPDAVLSPAEAMRDLEKVTVSPPIAARVRNGLAMDRTALAGSGGGPWAVVDETGLLLALYSPKGTDRAVAEVVIAPSS